MNTFAQRAFVALTQAKKAFGEYAYHDKGAHEVMEVSPLVSELKKMTVEEAGRSLLELHAMEDTGMLMSDLIGSLDGWDQFDPLLDGHPDLAEYY